MKDKERLRAYSVLKEAEKQDNEQCNPGLELAPGLGKWLVKTGLLGQLIICKCGLWIT